MPIRRHSTAAPCTAAEEDAKDSAILVLAESAEKEAAEIEARAASARARADELRRRIVATPSAFTQPDSQTSYRRRRPTPKGLAVVAALLLIAVSLAASGYFAWRGHLDTQRQQRATEFSAAARQDVTALMSLDFTKTKDNLQRISDNATGAFKQHFPLIADKLAQSLERSKIVTTVNVTDAAVESMSDNSAVVLVAATTKPQGSNDAQQQRNWHIVVDLLRADGKPKMSNVEFIE